jgi:hypothetical protein
MRQNRFRYLAAVLIGSGLFAPGALGADKVDCLVLQPLPIGSDGRLEATAVNTCAHAITAYKVEIRVLYADGTSAVIRGPGEDFLPGMAVASPGSGIGALTQREQRKQYLTTLQASQMKGPISKIEVTARCLAFDDVTAVGNEQEIDLLFRDRRDDLHEWTFWKRSFEQNKDEIAAQGPLARLVDLSNVRERERTMNPRYSPSFVRTRADAMQGMLEATDKAIGSGAMSRDEAVQWLERYLVTVTSTYEKHSERSK